MMEQEAFPYTHEDINGDIKATIMAEHIECLHVVELLKNIFEVNNDRNL